jgi:hypothetical protein
LGSEIEGGVNNALSPFVLVSLAEPCCRPSGGDVP